MPKFNYVAMDSRGKETKGTLEVASQNEAIGRLKEMGYFPTKVVEAEKPGLRPAKAKRLKKPAKEKGGFNLNFTIPAWAARSNQGFDRIHAAVGDTRTPVFHCCAACGFGEAGKSPALKRILSDLATASRWQHVFRGVGAASKRYSTGCLSTWSRPANWAACWKSS